MPADNDACAYLVDEGEKIPYTENCSVDYVLLGANWLYDPDESNVPKREELISTLQGRLAQSDYTHDFHQGQPDSKPRTR